MLARTNPSGPAAATRPRLEATLSREDVGGGSDPDGHGVGSSRIFRSPAKARNPRA